MGSSKKHKSDRERSGRDSKKKRRKSRSRSPVAGTRSRSRSPATSSTRSATTKSGSGRADKQKSSSSHHSRSSKKQARDASPVHDAVKEESSPRSDEQPVLPAAEVVVRIKEEPRSPCRPAHHPSEPEEEGEVEVPMSTGKDSSLSIADTNKLRAQLGLKPLDVTSSIPGLEGEEASGEAGGSKEVFVKTENLSEKREAEKLREKIAQQKERRRIVEKLSKVKTLGEDESDEDAAKWVEKSRKMQQEKEMAAKRAQLLEEMDQEFGVGALVEEEFGPKKAYTGRDLRGLTVGHDHMVFQEGRSVILTLKDREVLDEEGEDVLENVNLADDERAAKNAENRLRKPDYRPWEEAELDVAKKKKSILSKYDEEIEGKKTASFKLGMKLDKQVELMKLKQQQQGVVTLEMPAPKIANEYLTEAEMVGFKKRKKVRKVVRRREVLRADDLRPLPNHPPEEGGDHGSRSAKARPAEEEDEAELRAAIDRTRRLKRSDARTAEKVAEAVRKTADRGEGPAGGASIVLNATAEFCRTLGDIPTYGLSGNREEEVEELMELEREDRRRQEEEEEEGGAQQQQRGAWNEVDAVDEKPAEVGDKESKPILEEEPDASKGLAGALQLAMKKGYLEKEAKKNTGASRNSQLQAQAYTIEEKFYEDDKFGRRERYAGPLTDFREKDSYKPDIKLEYIDDSGRLLNPKEAFRYLSHKFHGKGPGKNKIDKRMKKLDQEGKLKQMSSTDTPLGTLRLLQEKQKELQSPYVLLSGGQKALAQTSIVKTK